MPVGVDLAWNARVEKEVFPSISLRCDDDTINDTCK